MESPRESRVHFEPENILGLPVLGKNCLRGYSIRFICMRKSLLLLQNYQTYRSHILLFIQNDRIVKK